MMQFATYGSSPLAFTGDRSNLHEGRRHRPDNLKAANKLQTSRDNDREYWKLLGKSLRNSDSKMARDAAKIEREAGIAAKLATAKQAMEDELQAKRDKCVREYLPAEECVLVGLAETMGINLSRPSVSSSGLDDDFALRQRGIASDITAWHDNENTEEHFARINASIDEVVTIDETAQTNLCYPLSAAWRVVRPITRHGGEIEHFAYHAPLYHVRRSGLHTMAQNSIPVLPPDGGMYILNGRVTEDVLGPQQDVVLTRQIMKLVAYLVTIGVCQLPPEDELAPRYTIPADQLEANRLDMIAALEKRRTIRVDAYRQCH